MMESGDLLFQKPHARTVSNGCMSNANSGSLTSISTAASTDVTTILSGKHPRIARGLKSMNGNMSTDSLSNVSTSNTTTSSSSIASNDGRNYNPHPRMQIAPIVIPTPRVILQNSKNKFSGGAHVSTPKTPMSKSKAPSPKSVDQAHRTPKGSDLAADSKLKVEKSCSGKSTSSISRGTSSSSSGSANSSSGINISSIVTVNSDDTSVARVQSSVVSLVKKWVNISPIPPDQFLEKILRSRGYACDLVKCENLPVKRTPTPQQVQDYDNELVWAIRNSDLPKIMELHASGKRMDACNRYSESIVHMACRRSELEVVNFLLTHGASTAIVDDYGRTPLHDACWRPTPRFDIVTRILDENLDLLRWLDVRGSTPLKYVREEHWLDWCAYFFHQKEKYWSKLDRASAIAKSADPADEPSKKRQKQQQR